MIKRILTVFKSDSLFQFRSGLHSIYAILTIFYVVIISQLPTAWAKVAVPYVIFSDPSVLGFFFIGGLVMLEKTQGMIDFIAITPVRTKEYLLGKVLSLALISLVASFLIALLTKQSFNLVLLFIGITLTSSFFTLLGLYIALSCNTMNQYFGKAIPFIFLIILPCFSLIGFPYSELFYLTPCVSAAKIIINAFYYGTLLETLICILILVGWNIIMYHWICRRFDHYSTQGGGYVA